MRVLLTTSYLGRREMPVFPLGLGYLASCLEGHQVMCLDLNVVKDPWSELANAIADFRPQVIGISLRNIDTALCHSIFSYWLPFVKLVKWVRSHKEDIRLIVGGSGFPLFPVEIMQ